MKTLLLLIFTLALGNCARIKRVTITNNNFGGSGIKINNNDFTSLSGNGFSITNNNGGGIITNTNIGSGSGGGGASIITNNNGASSITNTNVNGVASTVVSTSNTNIPLINVPLLPVNLMSRQPKLVMDTYGNLYILRFIRGKPFAYYIGNQEDIVIIPTESLIGATIINTTNGKVGTLSSVSGNSASSSSSSGGSSSSIITNNNGDSSSIFTSGSNGGTSIINSNSAGSSITNTNISGSSSGGGSISIVNNNGKK